MLRSRWPNIPEDDLVELCCAWASSAGVRAVLVFDGKAPGGLVGERDVSDLCLLVGSGGDSADEWIERAAEDLDRYWLVTSDRALRAAAGRRAEHLIGGGTFARELLDNADGI